jgi:DNA topoisomerase-1
LAQHNAASPPPPQVIRVAFNEITREAVLHALAHPRSVSTPLVEAYLARRALDYVMGYGLSPVLWRKLPGSKSAGRVQSVALRLVTDREHAIRTFHQREYWSVDAACQGPRGDAFQAALTHLDGQRLGQFGILTAEEAQRAAGRVAGASLEVAEVKRSKVRKAGGAQEGGSATA